MAKINNIPELRFPEFTDNWDSNLFGNIASFNKGKGISKADIIEDGETECIRYGELYTTYNEVINDVKSKTNIPVADLILSEENDVIIPASGETQIDIARASCVIRSGIALGGDLNIIKSKLDGIYLAYYLNNAKKKEIAVLAQGNSVVHLYSSQLKTLSINYPKPQEQEKIATFLMAIDKRISLLNQQKEQLELYKKGLMQKIFSRKIRFKDENGNDFPEWKNKPLEKIFYSEKGKGISKNKVVEKGKYECILYGELYTRYGEVINEVVSKTNEKDGISSKIGDLLIPCSTTTTGIDLANITALNKDNVLLGGDITILRSKCPINNVFYAYYLSNYKTSEIANYAQGITIVHLYYNHFKEMIIDLPSIEEQNQIAKFILAIDKQIEKLKCQIEKSIVYKKGILQKIFV